MNDRPSDETSGDFNCNKCSKEGALATSHSVSFAELSLVFVVVEFKFGKLRDATACHFSHFLKVLIGFNPLPAVYFCVLVDGVLHCLECGKNSKSFNICRICYVRRWAFVE